MREANTGEVQGLRREPRDLKEVVAEQASEDKAPMPARIWNRIPDNIREKILDLALEQPELSL